MLDYASNIDVPMHSSSFNSWYMEKWQWKMIHKLCMIRDYCLPLYRYGGLCGWIHWVWNGWWDLPLSGQQWAEVYDTSQAYTPAPIHNVNTTLIPTNGITEPTHPLPFPSSHMVPDIQHLVHEPSHDILFTLPSIIWLWICLQLTSTLMKKCQVTWISKLTILHHRILKNTPMPLKLWGSPWSLLRILMFWRLMILTSIIKSDCAT